MSNEACVTDLWQKRRSKGMEEEEPAEGGSKKLIFEKKPVQERSSTHSERSSAEDSSRGCQQAPKRSLQAPKRSQLYERSRFCQGRALKRPYAALKRSGREKII